MIILASSWITPADASQKRLLTPDDLLRLEELKEAVLSPDGQWLAYTVAGSRLGGVSFKQDYLLGVHPMSRSAVT